ncbi:MAG: tRNA (adenosine(37)-N6)-threonylcarbamoyltransferase complex ATPase subunit type 1 TsaE [Nitriliruptorales bacterium]|nr:tRNA (adenosine(37)-N6)-threonylcarbamoyltransferase complex ATPase subunit type 1 TsaE [Nitriliruptorales bacterium]
MSAEFVLLSRTPQETRKLAASVAGALRRGDVVALTGELGAGKTCFVQGAAAALGVTQAVTSPSFVLRREYPGDIPILHMDIYRLDTFQDIVDIGYEEVFDNTRVTFIEWGDAMSPLLPHDHLELEFRLPPADAPTTDGDEVRRIVVRPRGEDWLRRIATLRDNLQPWLDGCHGDTA